ncbi:MAG: class I SAM-dependent methyltransferase, partial [Bacteroidetes bacterium]
MLTKTEKAQLRGDIFRHLDGIATAPVAHCLYTSGVTDFLLSEKQTTLTDLTARFKGNRGYLNVGLRVLASQGWLDYEVDNEKNEVFLSVNAKSEVAFSYCRYYKDIVELQKISGQFHRRKFEREPFQKLAAIFEDYKNGYAFPAPANDLEADIQHQVLKHIEGMLVGPTTVALGMSGMFHKYFMEASFKPEEFHEDAESFERLLDFFVFLGWFDKKNGTYRFTEKGLFFARRASAYGVTVSYIPTFRRVEDLFFGNPEILWQVPPGAPEIHVDREMNVWGSGGAHST